MLLKRMMKCFVTVAASASNTGKPIAMKSLGNADFVVPMRPVQVGLTGSIGMGKSTCTKHFRAMGFPVFDADAAVHELYSANGGAVKPIYTLFPDVIVDGAISRPLLAKKVMEDSSVLKVLEKIVHPLVAQKRLQFYEDATAQGSFMVVYDIPLLLENPLSQSVDYVIVATADAKVQRERVLKRPGMTEEKFLSLLAKQMPDDKKREKADFLIHTDFESYAQGVAQAANIVELIIEKNPDLWTAWKSRLKSGAVATSTSTSDSEGKIHIFAYIDISVSFIFHISLCSCSTIMFLFLFLFLFLFFLKLQLQL